ncbi:lipase family alpha/beta hydrolase [Chloroflexus sp. MS-G]|jgi:pimeloyl-ACP methyl ester carboxylesterase|uniref:lipase family alpha/beta hydrolase n=1 Tax=Chloroflexus sp. MS-G TaxID=1521187 RepID=UPI0004DFCB64|nr:alpha/beta fold hydrolase [Chloroflexus sp. MS-G]MBO9348058.1 alpha/beta hydrolase [Chloroflexus sp.]
MSRLPVIFIPGFTGSFNLPVLLDWRGPTLNGWNFPPFVDYGKTLLQTFTQAGYRRNRDLFVAFYDWRKPVEESARNYLVPWIDRAKKAAGADKVILIGHSMGGLVARSYIQSSAYRNDVDRLITLGTPHRGSAEAYTAWAGAEPHADETLRTIFAVYLWYLRHAHPLQTELDPVKTIHTQVPGVRDLLPIDDYLLAGNPPQLKPVTSMVSRNLWGEMVNQPASVATLTKRVPVTTITGVGFNTLSTILVGPPPTDHPLRYADGVPLTRQYDSQGDGTVLQRMAIVPQANNLPSIPVSHGALPDSPQALALVFSEVGVAPPVLGAVPAAAPPSPTPRLVIMTASPITVEVEVPSGPPLPPAGVLGASVTRAARRRRRIRGRNYGHAGKALNLVVIDHPTAGDYRLVLHGTDSGHFAVGAMLIGAGEPPILGGEGAAGATAPTITTIEGEIARDADLFYTCTLPTTVDAPQLRFDVQSTMRAAMAQLGAALSERGGVLGAAPIDDDRLRNVLSGDSMAIESLMALPPLARRQAIDQLIDLCQTLVGDEYERAMAVITMLMQVRDAIAGA